MEKKVYKTKLYRCWEGMKARCYNPRRKEYKNYGGRGITVCIGWLSFKPFEKWAIKNGYKEGLELDRINVDEGYNPNNCRFVTHSENNLNKRKRIDNKSGFTGICFHKQNKKWGYEIQINKNRIRKYGFETAESAYKAKLEYIRNNNINYNNK